MTLVRKHWRVLVAALLGAAAALGVPSTVLDPIRAWLGF
jgi:hypothetical protein